MRYVGKALSALLAGALVVAAGLGPGTLGEPPATAPASRPAGIEPLVKALKARLPKTWELHAVRRGRTEPVHWPAGTGDTIICRRKGYTPADWKRGKGGVVNLYVMDAGYAAAKPLHGREAQVGPAREIARWRGRRVFVFGEGNRDWRNWMTDVSLAVLAAAADAAATRPAVRIDTDKGDQYKAGGWTYQLSAKDDPRILRWGHLFRNKVRQCPCGSIAGLGIGRHLDTPWGRMYYCGEWRHPWGIQGWHLMGPASKDPRPARLRLREAYETRNELVKHLKSFNLHLRYHGPAYKPYYNLTVRVPDIWYQPPAFWPAAQISQDDARMVLAALAGDGFLAFAKDVSGQAMTEFKGPRYTLTVECKRGTNKAMVLCEDLGWDLEMLTRLDGLRRTLKGEAAKAMDLLLGRLAGHRKAWRAAATQPKPVGPTPAKPKPDKPATRPAAQPDGGDISPTPASATPLCITNKWVLWQTHELIPETAHHRAEIYIIRFYLQRLGQERARLAWTTRDTNVRWRATVLDDGTPVICWRSRLVRILPDGKAKPVNTPMAYPRLDGQSMEMLELYPDGVVLRNLPRKDEPLRAWFVPMRAGKWVADGKVALTGEKGFRSGKAPRLKRHGGLLAWVDDGVLKVLDIKTGKRTEHGKIARGLLAFDGEMAVTGSSSLDLKSGKSKRFDGYFVFLAVRNRIGYAIKGMEHAVSIHKEPKNLQLLAVDLDSGRQRVLAKWSNAKIWHVTGRGPMGQAFGHQVRYGYSPVLSVGQDKGLRMWNGRSWMTHPWLTRLDQADAAATGPATAPAARSAPVKPAK